RPRQSLFHRADAGRRAGGGARHRPGRGDQRRVAGRQRARPWRRRSRPPPASLARRAARRGGGVPEQRGLGMILSPGATVGVLGGGQLGRMLAIAALKIGLRCHVYAPEDEAPAYDAAHVRTVAAYEDEAALRRFAGACDLVTFEFENVPTATLEFIQTLKAVRPSPRALALTQDRLTEKTFLRGLGFETAPFADVADAGALTRAVRDFGRPSILKTRRFGYDGKGQTMIREGSDLEVAHRALGGGPMILEGFV